MPRETVAVKEVDEEILRLVELRADLGAQVGGIFE
jgi:chorismate mutase